MLQSPTSTDGEGFSLNLSNDSLPSSAWNSPSPQPNLNITDVMGKIFFSFKSQFTIASHLTGCSPEVAKLTPQIIRGVPRGHALSPRIVEFVQNYAACRNLQPADLKYYLNGVSVHLFTTEKERESRREMARATAERYVKDLEACKARLMDLHFQQQQLLKQVRREESRRNVLKTLVERQSADQTQEEKAG